MTTGVCGGCEISFHLDVKLIGRSFSMHLDTWTHSSSAFFLKPSAQQDVSIDDLHRDWTADSSSTAPPYRAFLAWASDIYLGELHLALIQAHR